MPVIAMTREMGSGGREVAQRVADELQLTLVLHHLVEHEIADHLELREDAVHHLLEGGATLTERLQVGSGRLARYTAEEILELANRGNVLIRGWGACLVLREVPHVVRVRVCAPMDVRERTVMQRQGIKDRQTARREIERNDATHKRILRNVYGVDREEALLYDLMLNTERCSIETSTKLVCDLADRTEFRETNASRAILNDKTLEAHIRIKLRERFGTGLGAMGVTGIEATAHNGKIVLRGTAIHGVLVDDASKLASAVPGVKEVENQMVIVHGPRAFT
ncbi:cytidylate kinase family protein [Bradyrhizobium manausense]|uniref:cytidylate kinase family protein n=1 Tax=Bradyrhizobium TaxID=374 RepID=UPI001BA44307|nr:MULTISPECIES: cytidylate kinase family protein [Bradyrhizobium]MBR0824862.1 cytidylate kinase family protein [Bradyrhizobium manausense]UVO29365.1 cytidylate kinase family protein [Bradyrhizobium arachidis]